VPGTDAAAARAWASGSDHKREEKAKHVTRSTGPAHPLVGWQGRIHRTRSLETLACRLQVSCNSPPQCICGVTAKERLDAIQLRNVA
jgi:hypothetical protein